MNVRQSAQKTVDNAGCLSLAVEFARLGRVGVFEELSSSAQLHAEVDEARVLIRLVIVDDVGVVH